MPLVIDVRTVTVWDKGHRTVLIPYDQIRERISSVVKDNSKKIYLYRRTGQRAMIGISYYLPYNESVLFFLIPYVNFQ
jgi:rhodanese-related sulfurtransferase